MAANAMAKSLRERSQWLTYLHLWCRDPIEELQADRIFSFWHEEQTEYLIVSAQVAVTAAINELGLRDEHGLPRRRNIAI